MKTIFFLVLIPAFLFLKSADAQTCNRQQDSLSLVQFYTALNGPNWIFDWNLAQPMDTWWGVVLTPEGCIKSIDLQDKISGNLPDLQLPFLEILSIRSLVLTGSGITGLIPDFSGLGNLKEFTLSANDTLSEVIPDFSNLPKLNRLELESINFPGSIPDFTNLPQLKTLIFNSNNLGGSVPDFQNMPSLEELNLSSNLYSGAVTEFSNLPVLKKLILSGNKFSGAIPDFQNLDSLEVLDLGGNPNLEGTIPDFQYLPNLKELYLGGQKGLIFFIFVNIITVTQSELTGFVPDFSNLPKLEKLVIQYVKCTGPIPDFSNLPNLKTLTITGRQLSGSVPDFSNLSQLNYLTLGGYEEEIYLLFAPIPLYHRSDFSGTVPDFSNLPELINLDLRLSLLTGEVPDFSNLSVAERIWLSHNLLGPELTDFSNLPEAKIIDLSVNTFKGIIPGFSMLPELAVLYLDQNKLDSLGLLMNTSGKVSLSGNRLTFDDILPNLDLLFQYHPQDTLPICVTTTAGGGAGPVFNLGFDSGVTNNTYEWYLSETLMATTSDNKWEPGFAIQETDTFRVIVSNPDAPQLTLITKQFGIENLCDTLDMAIDRIFKDTDLLLFPNPVHDLLNLQWNGAPVFDAYLRLVNITGGLVWEGKADWLGEGAVRTIPLDNAAEGAYIFQILSRQGTISRPVVVFRDK